MSVDSDSKKPPLHLSRKGVSPARKPRIVGIAKHNVAVPQPKNVKLDQELALLQRQIRDNERIWSGFRRIELGVIAARSLREVVQVLVNELPIAFPDVDCVSLACFDPEYELTRMLEQVDTAEENPDAVDSASEVSRAWVNITQEELAQLFALSLKPRLGRCEPALQRLLFPSHAHPLGSVALAPLILRGQLIGILNQGSHRPGHFTPGTATDLLEHLAAVTAMCLDNALNHERLKVYGLTDPLTGVANRRFFDKRVTEEVERWFRRGEPLVAMLVDIDHFKQVNDRFGHHVGDAALREVAELLGRDLRGADVLARYGGEEFVLLLPNTTAFQGMAIAQRLCQRVEKYPFAPDRDLSLNLTVSIGVACLDTESELGGVNPSGWLIQRADAALYEAKQSGRNRVVGRDAKTERLAGKSLHRQTAGGEHQ